LRAINGLHKENKGFSWDWEEGHRITAANGGVCMLDTLLTDVENGWWYPKLRAEFGPTFLIIIRLYPETGWPDPNMGFKWPNVDPVVWAREGVRRLTQERLRYNGLTPFEDPYVIVTPYNEQDLADEGHAGAAVIGRPHIELGVWRYIWETNYRWNQAFRALKPGCAIGSAAMAGGHDIVGYPPEWEYKIPEAQRYLNDCDVLCIHAYFGKDGSGTRPDNGGWWVGLRALRPVGQREAQGDPPINGMTDPGGIVTQYPTKPFVVKEFGNFCHHDTATVERTMQGYNECYRAYSESGRCLLVTPFLWNSGDEHRENRIRGNWPLTRALQEMHRYPACEWPAINLHPGLPDSSGGETVGEQFEYILGFAEYAKAHPEIGKPISPLMYDANGTGVQYTETGMLHWVKASNRVLFFRAVGAN
jgi:hypothetical protein